MCAWSYIILSCCCTNLLTHNKMSLFPISCRCHCMSIKPNVVAEIRSQWAATCKAKRLARWESILCFVCKYWLRIWIANDLECFVSSHLSYVHAIVARLRLRRMSMSMCGTLTPSSITLPSLLSVGSIPSGSYRLESRLGVFTPSTLSIYCCTLGNCLSISWSPSSTLRLVNAMSNVKHFR